MNPTTLYLSYNDVVFTISVKHVGLRNSNWAENSINQHHVITVKAKSETREERLIRFDYWTSKAYSEMKTSKDTLDAFDAFLSDILIAKDYNYDEFCREFGFDKQNRIAYRGCQNSLKKWERLIEGMNLDLSVMRNTILILTFQTLESKSLDIVS